MISVLYLTRQCPNSCTYCAIRSSPLQERELSTDEWLDAFDILEDLGVEFHLILGNEPLMRTDIVELVSYLTNVKKVPYGLYTTCPPGLMFDRAQPLIDIGITNVSCGFDVIPNTGPKYMRDKAGTGIEGLIWFRDQGVRDLHASVTMSNINLYDLGKIVRYLSRRGIWAGLNPIHWNKDGKYDFFPLRSHIDHLIPAKEDIELGIGKLLGELEQTDMLHNPQQFLAEWPQYYDMNWHCNKPLIYTVDADGHMRCCGYRKGDECPNITIFDLVNGSSYWERWHVDQKNCPGCYWSCPWQAEHWKDNMDAIKYHKE